jgi:HD-GYP domain-containing protein (c-di-GMP phosphodiesterase class II)
MQLAGQWASKHNGTPREEARLGPVTTARPQVLYIDSTEAACRLLEHRFEARDFDFEAVSDAEAFARLAAQRFDVVVVACARESARALELLKAARDAHPDGLRLQVRCDPTVDEIIAGVNEGGLSYILPHAWSSDGLEAAIERSVEQGRARRRLDLRAGLVGQLERDLSAARAELESLSRDYHERILEGLLAVLGFRERGARTHSYRAASYAGTLGRELGLGERDLSALTRGALLHDLGKVGISDQILLKPGSLSESEWDEMRWHPALGHGLLHEFDFLGEARTIVLQHHERWDGTGYPNRLRGQDIHVGARITAVVDALDAMTSPRPYRTALPFDKAWTEIQRCAGTQFDPAIVRTFVGMGREQWLGMVSGKHAPSRAAVA